MGEKASTLCFSAFIVTRGRVRVSEVGASGMASGRLRTAQRYSCGVKKRATVRLCGLADLGCPFRQHGFRSKVRKVQLNDELKSVHGIL